MSYDTYDQWKECETKALGREEVAKLSSVKIAIFFFSLSTLRNCSYEHEVLASVALRHGVIGLFL